MADNAENEKNEESVESTARWPGLMTLIKAVAFISVIVLVEMTAVSMLIPSASETENIANKLAAADSAKEDNGDETSAEAKPTGQLASEHTREVSLGIFHVSNYNPDSGSNINIDFELYGIVLKDDENEFFDLYQASEKRIHEQITFTVRGTDSVDLTDPELGLIKRRILEKTNRALGKPLLREAIFSTFAFVER